MEKYIKKNVQLSKMKVELKFLLLVLTKIKTSKKHLSTFSVHISKENRNLTLTLALSYSGKWDILNAVKKIIVEKKNPDKISEDIFKQYLATKNVPEPELLIRTSGEFRISNFLLWQIAYTELYFSKILWPDFSRKDFLEAINEYQNRERRFGKTKEQIEC